MFFAKVIFRQQRVAKHQQQQMKTSPHVKNNFVLTYLISVNCVSVLYIQQCFRMPKKKTGQRKKHEKQRARQKEIRKKGKTGDSFQGQEHLSV